MEQRSIRPWIAVVSAFISFFATGVVCFFALSLLLNTAYGRHTPNDASVGDTVGWALVIGSPIFIPLIVLISILVAIEVYRRIRLPKHG
jgi:hypothetical protein